MPSKVCSKCGQPWTDAWHHGLVCYPTNKDRAAVEDALGRKGTLGWDEYDAAMKSLDRLGPFWCPHGVQLSSPDVKPPCCTTSVDREETE